MAGLDRVGVTCATAGGYTDHGYESRLPERLIDANAEVFDYLALSHTVIVSSALGTYAATSLVAAYAVGVVVSVIFEALAIVLAAVAIRSVWAIVDRVTLAAGYSEYDQGEENSEGRTQVQTSFSVVPRSQICATPEHHDLSY